VEPIYKNAVSTQQLQQADRATLAVSRIGCQNSLTRVRNSLLSLEGVYGVDVYLNMALAEVTFARTKVSPKQLVDVAAQAGNDGRHQYRAQLIATDWSAEQSKRKASWKETASQVRREAQTEKCLIPA
jgi:copper chaperone CopZ